MSRIGNKVITLPAGVEIINNDNVVTVKGPKGELTREFNKNIEIKVEGTEITLARPNDSKEMKTIHGTTRANLNNMVVGVSEGFKKDLEMKGVGYRAQLQGTKLVLSVGKSHQDEVEAQKELPLLLLTQLQSQLKESTKKLLVKQLLTSVACVHQSLIKVKGSVTLVNTYALKKVKQVNNVLSRVWEVLHLTMLDKFNRQLVSETN